MSKSEKKSRGKFGAFIGGSFLGFIFCLALLAGLCCFVYFKVSPNWINKTFKTEIDLGSEEANNKTLKDLVNVVVGVAQNTDTYTLSSLNDDFGIGIKDELFGIDIKDIKSVPLSELAEAVENKFGTISADELRNVSGMDLEINMGNILNMDNTYYFNSSNEKLYKDYDGTNYSNEVNFDYELSEDKSKIITKGHETEIDLNNEVKIQLWYLPLTSALGDFTSDMGDNITLYELEENFGVQLPSFLNKVDKENTTINELEDAINGLYVADFLGYTIDDSDEDNIIVKDGDKVLTGVMATLAKFKVSGLEAGIEGLTISQIFDEEQMQTGILSLLTTDPTIAEIPQAIEDVIVQSSIHELYDKQIIKLDAEDVGKLLVYIDHDNNSSTENVMVGSLNIEELLDYCFNFIPNS